MHVGIIKFLQHKCTTYIHNDLQNKGYAPGLALGRGGVSEVSQRWLRDLLRHENLLLVLLDDLLVLLIFRGDELHQLILYMHAMMIMQQFSIRQQQLLKLDHINYTNKLSLMAKLLTIYHPHQTKIKLTIQVFLFINHYYALIPFNC
jgi:hypothetical protein